jgi:flagellar biosynthesis protein FliP
MFEQLPAQAAFFVALALLPLGLAACTAFTKVSIVLAALRTGLGAEKLLPYGVILALAVVVTAVVMGPTAVASWTALEDAGGPAALAGAELSAWLEVLAPLREFLLAHADPGELDFFAGLHDLPSEHPLVLVPAFLLTELAEALHIAVLILVPFVVVDLLAAQVLVLLGLGQAPSPIVALPAKVLLFLAVGGWQVVVAGLVEGYA